MSDMDSIEVFKVFVDLTDQKAELKARLHTIEEELDKQKELMFPIFEENPNMRMTVAGRTVFLTHRYAAKLREGAERSSAADALAAWIPELVRYDFNLNSVSAFMRERLGDGIDPAASMPEDVAEFFEIKDWFDVQAMSVSE